MITPNDFKNAIGKPDKNFENSVRQALDEIQFSERRTAARKNRPLRYIMPAAALAAVAVCALLIFGTTGGQPDRVAGQGSVLAQPSAKPAATVEPTPDESAADSELPEHPAATAEPTPPQEGIEQPEQTAAPVQPTPPPVSTNLPKDHWMLTDTLGIDINSLYPGYIYVNTASDQYGNSFWMVGNGQQNIVACSISYGHIKKSDSESGTCDCPTLYVYMPNGIADEEHIDAIMADSAPWLSAIYESSRSMVQESDPEFRLSSLQITFDENSEPQICEIYFGLNCESCITWMREEDTGEFAIIKLYTQPEYVPISYTDPADYDTMQVSFADPALEAAIRTELDWQGVLTPAKLAEVESLDLNGIPLESLSGIEYCTNLQYLDLSGCGIGDENLKYVCSLPSLKKLLLHGNGITNITDLTGLDLTFLVLSDNSITNLWPISGMTNLQELYLSGNPLSGNGTLKPLEGLASLNVLDIENCGVTDLTSLEELDIEKLYLDN